MIPSKRYGAAMIGIILVVAIAYNVQFFLSRGSHGKAGAATKPASQERTGYAHDKMQNPVTEQEDGNPWKRDPFGLREASGRTAHEQNAKLHLMGIIKRNGRSLALINGQVYTVGDVIDDAVIKEIKRHSIVVLSEGKSYELSFNDYVVLEEKSK